jgi:hypothetical protein
VISTLLAMADAGVSLIPSEALTSKFDRRRPPSSSSSFRTFATPTNGGLIRSANPMVLNMATIPPAKFHEEEEKITTTTTNSSGDEDEVSNDNFVNTVNAVLADFVDGQNYLKETGRTTPRPMKRRALIVCLALSGLRKHADDLLMSQNNFQRTRSNLRSNSPSSFATTWKLASQVSFGASKHASDQTDTVM